MPTLDQKSQQLHAVNVSADIGEALEARVKDPLWFLARQWQSGEFEAENGGGVAQIAVSSIDHVLENATIGEETHSLDVAEPLEVAIEAENNLGDAAAWRKEALEYNFSVDTAAHTLVATEYSGKSLDWYHFELSELRRAASPTETTQRVVPTQLYFRGAPHARWWRFEDGDAYFDSPVDSEPNVLSLLMPEFFYTDINNWYVTPTPVPAGCLREVTLVTVVDSFGVVSELNPVVGSRSDEDWQMYSLDSNVSLNSGQKVDGRYLFVPNVALDVLHNSDLEEVRFLRDEDANLVWAYERRYQNDSGDVVVNGDGVGSESFNPPGDAEDLPRFALKSAVPPYWIPYVPRFEAAQSATKGETHLRRGRTMEAATQANPQYKSKIVSESMRINEEEIPISGVRVRRIARYARGSDGKAHFWVGRLKESATRTAQPSLRFDLIESD